MPKQVTFQVEGDSERLTVRSLIDLLERTLSWLRSLDPDLPMDWQVVRAKLTSPYRFTFENPSANGSISTRMREFHGFAAGRLAGKGLPAPRLSEEEIESTSRLANVIGDVFTEARITSRGDPTVRLNKDVAKKVEVVARAMRTQAHSEWTTVRGTLYEVTVSNGARNFKIKHQLTGSSIPCTLPDHLLPKVKDALPSRVEAYGCARFNRLGQPMSIDAERFRRLPDADVDFDLLPATHIAGGSSAREHVERVRRGE